MRLVVRGRQTDAKHLARRAAGAVHVARVGRAEQGPEEARLPVRGLDDLLFVHAGGWHGQRSHARLPIPQEGRSRIVNPGILGASAASGPIRFCRSYLTMSMGEAMLFDFTCGVESPGRV